MMKLAPYWFILLPLTPGAYGLPGWPMGGTIVAGDAVQFDRDSWEANLAHPNATGNNQVIGPDSQAMNPSNATGKTFTGTSIFLQAPENLRTTFSDESALDETTWKICVIVVPNAPQENVTAAEGGTCSIMSSQCVSDLQQAYVEKFSRNQDCYGTPPSTPSSCDDAINTGNFNVQQLPLDSIGGKEVFVTASEAHDPGDEKVWDDARTRTWPVLTIWGWNSRANASGDASPTVRLSCISARDVESGSGALNSAGSRYCGSAVAALVVACIATSKRHDGNQSFDVVVSSRQGITTRPTKEQQRSVIT
ncbi:hypothetical protein E0Z10_g1581 [Xylaria hypoxylon]|uniref:Uncharacterized protein n=1 Tax=Xylaria hypoxylon TaxID=37992 RepID=A0A4Z0ZEE3_9PEZI|nr:hypothetical protein E0Z10_g1581 [Xylaria hypoxylon]